MTLPSEELREKLATFMGWERVKDFEIETRFGAVVYEATTGNAICQMVDSTTASKRKQRADLIAASPEFMAESRNQLKPLLQALAAERKRVEELEEVLKEIDKNACNPHITTELLRSRVHRLARDGRIELSQSGEGK